MKTSKDINHERKKSSRPYYTVWVGGGEVNDNLLTKDEAMRLASEYRNNGYDDVVIEKGKYQLK